MQQHLSRVALFAGLGISPRPARLLLRLIALVVPCRLGAVIEAAALLMNAASVVDQAAVSL